MAGASAGTWLRVGFCDAVQTMAVAVCRADELRLMMIGFDLSPQSSDGEVDRSGADVGVEISPDSAKQFVAANDPVAMLGEVAQQLELAMRQRNRPPAS